MTASESTRRVDRILESLAIAPRIVAPQEDTVIPGALVLASPGYTPKRLSDVPALPNKIGSRVLFLVQTPTLDAAREAIRLIESNGRCCPTVCVTRDGKSSGDAVDNGKPWIRTVSFPLDCFTLSSTIKNAANSCPNGASRVPAE
ncbi:MAG: hypothetical protein IH987_22065 [Planctomycetes bacterium]|nr:hypothetical protein [Planctomycetota bacterium]